MQFNLGESRGIQKEIPIPDPSRVFWMLRIQNVSRDENRVEGWRIKGLWNRLIHYYRQPN